MKRTASASLFALVTAGTAQAQPQAPLGGNVVGGGGATISGGSDDTTITYSAGGAGGGGVLACRTHRPLRWHTRRRVVGGVPGPGARRPERDAWLHGGGDSAEVVYVQPR